MMPVIIRTTSLHPFDAISYELCQCSGTEQIIAWLGSPGGSHFREFSKRQDHCSKFVETESGERNDRPQLQAALVRCKVTRRDVGLWPALPGESGMARTSCHFRV